MRYLIEWAGIDPATGRQWEPSWVKGTNASEGLRTAWRKEQAQVVREKKRAAAATKGSAQVQQQGARAVSPAQATQTQSATPEHVAESTEASSVVSEDESYTESRQDTVATPSLATFVSGASVPDIISTQDIIEASGETSKRGEHELHAEIPESQHSPSKAHSEDTDLESLQLFASQPAFRASGIVPDTQSSRGNASYIPVTQEELDSTIYSDSSDESEERIIGYSVSKTHTTLLPYSLICEGSPQRKRTTIARRTRPVSCYVHCRDSR